jgi:glucuronate isomerase
LNRYFGIRENLSGSSAAQIYEEACDQLKQPGNAVQGLLKKMNVEVVCTTDDPIDTLEHHIRCAGSDYSVRILPTWRPDKALIFYNIDNWNTYIDTLSERSGISIQTYDDLLEALQKRHDFFHKIGCRLSDHGLEVVPRIDLTPAETRQTFATLRKERYLPNDLSLCDRLSGQLLLELARMDSNSGWVQQFHIGALRNNSTRALHTLGPDTGFDSIGDLPVAQALSRFLDQLDSEGNLAKTILYNLNPSHNEVFASMTGNFQDGSVPGKIQWGSAWWFLDQKDGMEKQINTLSNFGLLSRFVGMLTDSRSFLSYPRHEYFRRILCNFIGDSVEKGEWPNDPEWLGQLVEGICYNNARSYFGF